MQLGFASPPGEKQLLPFLRELASDAECRQEAYEVEFIPLAGQTATIVTDSADQIRPIGKHEIPNARELAHR